MSFSEEFFPFDGSCECSKDANFTLFFDDGSSLKISKCLLEMASPVFKTALGECDHDGSLHLAETSKDAWILILNFIHPSGRSVSYAEEVMSNRPPTLIDVLRQCEKYGFVSLQQDLDKRLVSCIFAMEHAIILERVSSPYVGHPETYLVVDPKLVPIQAVRLFDLPQSEEAMASYLICVLKENNFRMRKCKQTGVLPTRGKINEAMGSISEVVTQMRANGRHKLCSSFAQKIVEARIWVSMDLLNIF